MEDDLKKENSRNIFLIMATSLALSVFFQFDLTSISSLIEIVVAGSGGLMIAAVLLMFANILPQSVKHKLVFTRLINELPACRIDQLCRKDSRIEYETIKNRWPEVFSENIDSATRNSRWYQQIYKPVKDTREVLQAHRAFLLYRDTFSGLALIFLATIVWSLIGDSKIIGEIKPVVFLIQGALMIVSLIAARISGNRFVVNAVAAAE
ncbi:MAG TPA: hypothetical protein PKJ85_01940 [Nitrosomonas nitrosa]|nr:hypothetical protein [Nitrosomonas nitrosa]